MVLATQACLSEPTDQELIDWWGGLETEERLGHLRDLVAITNGEPEVAVPDFLVVVTRNQVVAEAQGPLVVTVGPLGWDIYLGAIEAPYDPEQRPTWLSGLLVGLGGGLLAGLVIGLFAP